MSLVKELAREQLSFKEIEELYFEMKNKSRVIPMNNDTKKINEFSENMFKRRKK